MENTSHGEISQFSMIIGLDVDEYFNVALIIEYFSDPVQTLLEIIDCLPTHTRCLSYQRKYLK